MIALIVGGFSVWVRKATHWRVEKGTVEMLNSRGRVLATFDQAKVVAVFYDNDDVTTYGFASKADML